MNSNNIKRENDEFRAERLGMTLEEVEYRAFFLGVSADRYLDMLYALAEPIQLNPFDTILELCAVEESELTDSQIRKQLKYEKNPMRIKQLNKMLSKKKRGNNNGSKKYT